MAALTGLAALLPAACIEDYPGFRIQTYHKIGTQGTSTQYSIHGNSPVLSGVSRAENLGCRQTTHFLWGPGIVK